MLKEILNKISDIAVRIESIQKDIREIKEDIKLSKKYRTLSNFEIQREYHKIFLFNYSKIKSRHFILV